MAAQDFAAVARHMMGFDSSSYPSSCHRVPLRAKRGWGVLPQMEKPPSWPFRPFWPTVRGNAPRSAKFRNQQGGGTKRWLASPSRPLWAPSTPLVPQKRINSLKATVP